VNRDGVHFTFVRCYTSRFNDKSLKRTYLATFSSYDAIPTVAFRVRMYSFKDRFATVKKLTLSPSNHWGLIRRFSQFIFLYRVQGKNRGWLYLGVSINYTMDKNWVGAGETINSILHTQRFEPLTQSLRTSSVLTRRRLGCFFRTFVVSIKCSCLEIRLIDTIEHEVWFRRLFFLFLTFLLLCRSRCCRHRSCLSRRSARCSPAFFGELLLLRIHECKLSIELAN